MIYIYDVHHWKTRVWYYIHLGCDMLYVLIISSISLEKTYIFQIHYVFDIQYMYYAFHVVL